MAAIPPDRRPPAYPLLTAEDLRGMPATQYRVKNVLPREGIAVVYGASGSGKSFLTMDLAAALSGLEEWHGHRVASCDVLYVCQEGHNGLPQRVQAYCAYHGADACHRVRYITASFSLLNAGNIAMLVESIESAGIYGGVVIIDTLSAASPGADENSSVDMGRILAAAARIREECRCLVILVHHSGKDVARGMRGHSMLFAAADAVIKVTRDENRRTWELEKSKDGLDGKSHPFRLAVVEIGIDEDGDPVTSCVVEPEERAADVVKRTKIPRGGNQKIVYEVAGELLRDSREHGKGGAPAERPCIQFDALIESCIGRLPVDPKRTQERGQEAIIGLVNRGALKLRDGWIWVT
ncbi:AAA family ATPase [Nitrosovibrio sp. Nv17]|uniref:AAA family ATPase n=1 Tax=Nitrosovibrio sp. Nv17 TaxID=1855339 RepID=UPI000930EE25|nr:AAA family ATPase [Nitrosovibrio sp. Nv17]